MKVSRFYHILKLYFYVSLQHGPKAKTLIKCPSVNPRLFHKLELLSCSASWPRCTFANKQQRSGGVSMYYLQYRNSRYSGATLSHYHRTRPLHKQSLCIGPIERGTCDVIHLSYKGIDRVFRELCKDPLIFVILYLLEQCNYIYERLVPHKPQVPWITQLFSLHFLFFQPSVLLVLYHFT